MNKSYELLKKANVFYIATVDGEKPKVRPFGATALIDGKTYICTANFKEVYKQIKNSNEIEICAMLSDTSWLRISSKVVEDKDLSKKEEFLKQCPLPMYKADDGKFAIFYLTNVKCVVESFEADKKEYDT